MKIFLVWLGLMLLAFVGLLVGYHYPQYAFPGAVLMGVSYILWLQAEKLCGKE